MTTAKELPHSVKLVTIWLVVTLLVFLGFKAYERESQASRIHVGQGAVVLRRDADGHFHWPGTVNGVHVDFLVDTGATGTALPQSLAERVGLRTEGAVRTRTAGGAAQGWWARADIGLQGDVSAERLPVTVLPDLAAPLLGMDVLSKLNFSQRDGELRIEAGRR